MEDSVTNKIKIAKSILKDASDKLAVQKTSCEETLNMKRDSEVTTYTSTIRIKSNETIAVTPCVSTKVETSVESEKYSMKTAKDIGVGGFFNISTINNCTFNIYRSDAA